MTERLYYRHGDLDVFDARILSIKEARGSRAIELDRTAFYPSSGGQPHDTGRLGEASVISVEVVANNVWHTVVGGTFEVGQTVCGRVDRERRIDHTQQHSAQHVLSAAFESVANLHTVSFHLGTDVSTIDLDQPTITPTVLTKAEHLAQSVVFENRPVLVHYLDSIDLDQATLRKVTERLGTVRIVEIADFDRSACGGTHVGRTGQIGPIKIRRTERRGSTTRVEFLAGWRALKDYSDRLQITRAIADQLSAKDTDIGQAVRKVLAELSALRVQSERLQEALLSVEADELARTSTGLSTNSHICLVRQSYVNRSPTELKLLALRLVTNGLVVAILGTTAATTSLVFAQSDGLPFEMNGILRDVVAGFGGRGGGTRNVAQGGGPPTQSLDEILDRAVALLRTRCTLLPNVP